LLSGLLLYDLPPGLRNEDGLVLHRRLEDSQGMHSRTGDETLRSGSWNVGLRLQLELPGLQAGLLPDRRVPVPADDLLQASVVPAGRATSGVLHAVCAGMPYLQGSLHVLPHGIDLRDEARPVHGLSHGTTMLQTDDSVHDLHDGS
jgi:hypothetical protein